MRPSLSDVIKYTGNSTRPQPPRWNVESNAVIQQASECARNLIIRKARVITLERKKVRRSLKVRRLTVLAKATVIQTIASLSVDTLEPLSSSSE